MGLTVEGKWHERWTEKGCSVPWAGHRDEGICIHREAEGEAQRNWVGTEQKQRDAPAVEVTQVLTCCGKQRSQKVSVLDRS